MHSSASLDMSAKIVTGLVLAIIGFVIYPLFKAESLPEIITTGVVEFLLLGTMLFAWLFAPRSYSIDNTTLIIHRIIRDKEIPLSSLKSITYFPEVKKGITIRTFGNGGLFGYFGRFYNDAVGNFRMYSSKGSDFYILDLSDQKIGISPDNKALIEMLQSRISK